MQRPFKVAVAHLALVLLTVGGAAPAQAEFPSRPVTIVVPFAAGGPTDAVARHLATAMSRQLGQTVEVENQAGQGGTRAPTALAKAQPDGHTLLLHHIGMATAPALFRRLGYDPQRDFEPIGLVVDAPMVLLAHPSVPAANARQLMEHIKRNEATVTIGYAGPGAASHLCGLLLASVLRVDLISVPYTGTGPALAALERGSTDLLCDQTTAAMPAIASGRIRAFAVTTPKRLQVLPDLPTTSEQGIAGLQLAIWHGLYAPRGTPAPIVATLSRALQEAVTSPSFVAAMSQVGTMPVPAEQATPKQLRQKLSNQTTQWRPLIVKSGQFAD